MPKFRVTLSIEADVDAETPIDAGRDLYTIVKNQLDKVPKSICVWKLRSVISTEKLCEPK